MFAVARVLAAGVLAVSTLNPASTRAATTVISNVNVVTLDDRGVILGGNVVVANGRIEEILKAGSRLPQKATIIDGEGAFLLPGLIDSHYHHFNSNDLTSQLRYGVTTVLSLATPEPLDQLMEDRRRVESGELVGAHLYATGPSIGGYKRIESVSEVEPFLSGLEERGLEFVKVYNDISQEVFDAIVAGARRRNMGVFGHLSNRVSPEYEIAHGLNVISHMEEFFFTEFDGPVDEELETFSPNWTPNYARIDPILDLVATNEVAIIPNLVAAFTFQDLWVDEERTLDIPDLQNQPEDVVNYWRTKNYSRRDHVERRMLREQIKYALIRTMTYRASERGILLLAGSDAPVPGVFPGRGLHQELRLLAAAGLSNEQVLRAATVNAGTAIRRFVDRDACIGKIVVGCEADFILLRGNPIADLRQTESIVAVVSDGNWWSRDQLDKLAHLDR